MEIRLVYYSMGASLLLSDIACLSGIDANDFEPVGGDVAQKFAFETSGGFKDDSFGLNFLKPFDEFSHSFERIGNGECLVRSLRCRYRRKCFRYAGTPAKQYFPLEWCFA